MSRRDIRRPVRVLLEALSAGSADRGVPPDVVDEARHACARRFGDAASARVLRVEAYWWGVVRRHVLRGGVPALRDRLLVASFAEELTAAGHSPADVYEEITRVYGGVADADLLEEYRPRRPAHAA
jgi:hypothetical protein